MANSNAADGELQRKIDEYKARERVYLAGLLGQEAETGHLRQMAVDVLSTYGDVSKAAVRGALVYPTANMEVLLLRQKLCEKDKQINLLKEELEANRFDQRMPDGQALMRKCKALLTENRELGEEIREERIAELRAALQTEQRQNGQLYQKVQEASDFCKELSEENEKLQGTIARVAGRLRESRSELEVLVKERAEAKKKRKLDRDAKVAAAAAAKAVAAAAGVGCSDANSGFPVVPEPLPLPQAPPMASPVPAPLGSPVQMPAATTPVSPIPSPVAALVSAPMPAPLAACASPVQMQPAATTPVPLPSPVEHQVFAPGPVEVEKKKKDKKEKSRKRKSEKGAVGDLGIDA